MIGLEAAQQNNYNMCRCQEQQQQRYKQQLTECLWINSENPNWNATNSLLVLQWPFINQ